jgi:predicted phosphodiesterase
MALFRLLQLSDLHFFRTPRAVGLPDSLQLIGTDQFGGFSSVSGHDPDIAEAAARFAWANRDGYDAIVITGDLATTGDPADLRLAHAFIQSLPQDDSDGQPLPVAVIPGNHDRFVDSLFPTVFPPGANAFDQIYAHLWRAGQGVQLLHTVKRQGRELVLLGADFCLRPGDTNPRENLIDVPFDHLGRGKVYLPVIRELVTQTKLVRERDPEALIVWAIHFEPKAQEKVLELVREELLQSAIETSPPTAILCGHTHRKSRVKRFAGADVVCCGTTTQYYTRDGYFLNIVELEAHPGQLPEVLLRGFQFDENVHEFVEL